MNPNRLLNWLYVNCQNIIDFVVIFVEYSRIEVHNVQCEDNRKF